MSQFVDGAVSTTQSVHALALQMLERHGVLTREAVLAEGVRGGFAGVYGVLKALEERGTVRRGYFVDGLGGAQFAVPGAVDRLRACKEVTDLDHVGTPVVLAATDPAQPYGASIDWPATNGRAMRSAGAMVVLCDGDALAWFDVRSHHLVTFEQRTDKPGWAAVADALRTLVKDGRVRSVEIRKINGESHDDAAPATVGIVTELVNQGFVRGYRGLVLRDAPA